MKYGVWCQVSGGRTGTREGWLKSNGERQEFDDLAEATRIAANHTANMNRPESTATFRYEAIPI